VETIGTEKAVLVHGRQGESDHRSGEAGAHGVIGDPAGLAGRLDLAASGNETPGTGLDPAGRRKYLYHHEFRAQREQEKFDKLVRFADHLPELRAAEAAAASSATGDGDLVCLSAVRLNDYIRTHLG
jgi:hypothetical protein